MKRRDIHVYLCDQGLIYTGARIHPQPFRWDQMQVWRAVTRYSRNGIHTRTTYRYTIQRQDGYRIILQYFVGIKTLGETISNQITQAVLPQATQAYNAGQTVQFGSLSLNRQGVSNGWNVLPWSQVEAIDVTNGVVSVKRQGGWFRWSKVAASAIPNLFVFLALTNAILKSAGKR